MSIKAYEEGINDGIKKGQHIVLIKLLNKRIGEISEKYISRLKDLENKHIINIALNIFDIKNYKDFDIYLV